MPHKLLIPALLLLALAACSNDMGNADSDNLPDTSDTDAGEDTGDVEPDTGSPIPPSWYTLDATFVLVDELPTAESQVRLRTLDSDGATELCRVDVSPIATRLLEPSPDTDALIWWQLDLGEAALCGLPAVLDLAIAPWDSRLEPAVAQGSELPPTSTLNSLWLYRPERNDVLLAGYVSAQVDPLAPLEARPLPDMALTVGTLHLLPVALSTP